MFLHEVRGVGAIGVDDAFQLGPGDVGGLDEAWVDDGFARCRRRAGPDDQILWIAPRPRLPRNEGCLGGSAMAPNRAPSVVKCRIPQTKAGDLGS